MRKIFLLVVATMLLGMQDAAAAKKQKTVRVATAEEFLKALASDTRIVIPEYTVLKLTPALEDEEVRAAYNIGEFDSYAHDFSEYTTPRLGWHDNFDGKELEIAGFSNLTIEGEGEMAGIIVQPRYAYVLSFFNCQNITLRNLTLGHTDEGNCEGGVVRLAQCTTTVIEGCDLYGCGTEGIGAERSTDLLCKNTIIRDCSYQIMTLQHCKDFLFTECEFYNCREFTLLNINYCENTTLQSCRIRDNLGELFSIHGSPINVKDCIIQHSHHRMGNTDMAIIDANTMIEDPEADGDDCECGDGTEDTEDFTDWDWAEKPLTLPADVKKPTIRDFVIAACDVSHSPLLQTLGASVRNPDNNEIDVLEIDVPNGYILAGSSEANHLAGDYRAVECCYWRMTNGHSLFAINQLYEYDALGLRFYEYDPVTRILKPRTDISPYKGLPGEYECRNVLPHVGKSIQMIESGNIYHQMATQTWNGERFVLELTDKASQFGGTPHFAGGEFDMISFIKKYYPDSF